MIQLDGHVAALLAMTGRGVQCLLQADSLTADYADHADKTETIFNYPVHPRNPRVMDVKPK